MLRRSFLKFLSVLPFLGYQPKPRPTVTISYSSFAFSSHEEMVAIITSSDDAILMRITDAYIGNAHMSDIWMRWLKVLAKESRELRYFCNRDGKCAVGNNPEALFAQLESEGVTITKGDASIVAREIDSRAARNAPSNIWPCSLVD